MKLKMSSIRKLIREMWLDAMSGGVADDSSPLDYDLDQIELGVEDEMEHTDDPETAMEIAMDHLEKDPDYYTLHSE